jgi:hypothetical protein
VQQRLRLRRRRRVAGVARAAPRLHNPDAASPRTYVPCGEPCAVAVLGEARERRERRRGSVRREEGGVRVRNGEAGSYI